MTPKKNIYIYITFGWIFGSFGISKTLLYVFPLFIRCFLLLSVMENMQHLLCVKRLNPAPPLALVVSGPTPSEPSVAETRLFFLAYIVCMREARPDLSMRKTPCMIQRSTPTKWDKPNEHRALFCSSSPPTCCHVARPVLAKKLNYKQTNVCKNASVGFSFTGAKLSLFVSSQWNQCFFFFCLFFWGEAHKATTVRFHKTAIFRKAIYHSSLPRN